MRLFFGCSSHWERRKLAGGATLRYTMSNMSIEPCRQRSTHKRQWLRTTFVGTQVKFHRLVPPFRRKGIFPDGTICNFPQLFPTLPFYVLGMRRAVSHAAALINICSCWRNNRTMLSGKTCWRRSISFMLT